MLKNNRRVRLWLLAWAALTLLAAGCTQTGGTDTEGQGAAAQLAEGPEMLYFYNGVINTDGQMIVQEDIGDCWILYDNDGRQTYVEVQLGEYDQERRDKYNDRMLLRKTFTYYDKQGQQLLTTTIQAEDWADGIEACLPPDGDLANTCILVNQLPADGCFRVLDVNGKEIVRQQVVETAALPEVDGSYADIYVGDGAIFVQPTIYYANHDWLDKVYIYDRSGAPLSLDREYMYVWPIYNDSGRGVSGYYDCRYIGPQGQYITDILDGNGNVVLDNISELASSNKNVVEIRRGFEQGLYDLQSGEWLFKESIFTKLDD